MCVCVCVLSMSMTSHLITQAQGRTTSLLIKLNELKWDEGQKDMTAESHWVCPAPKTEDEAHECVCPLDTLFCLQ